MGAQLTVPMEKNGALLVSSLARRSIVGKEHGDGVLDQILGSLVAMSKMASLVNLATMGSKKLPLDVAKSHFNTKDKLTITVLALVIRVRGATLKPHMVLNMLKHGATVRN